MTNKTDEMRAAFEAWYNWKFEGCPESLKPDIDWMFQAWQAALASTPSVVKTGHQPQKTIVTVYLPSGYSCVQDFLDDCQLEACENTSTPLGHQVDVDDNIFSARQIEIVRQWLLREKGIVQQSDGTIKRLLAALSATPIRSGELDEDEAVEVLGESIWESMAVLGERQYHKEAWYGTGRAAFRALSKHYEIKKRG